MDPGLDRQPPLPQHIQILVKRAEKNPRLHLRAVIEKGTEYGNTVSCHPRVLDLYIEQFESSYTEYPLSDHKNVLDAIIGIACALPDACDSKRSTLLAEQKLLQAWPKVWGWFKHIICRLAIEIMSSPEKYPRRIRMHDMISSILEFLIHTETTRAIIAGTEGVLGLVTKLYLDLAERATIWPLPANQVLRGPISICNAMATLIDHPSTDFDEVLEELPTKRKRATMVLFGPLHAVASTGETFWHCCRVPVIRVLASILQRDPSFYRRLSLEIIIARVCHPLTKMVNDFRSLQAKDDISSRDVLTHITCFILFLLKFVCHVPRDHSWIIFAGKHGLLIAGVNTVILSQDPDAIGALEMLLNHFSVYSLYRPVLRTLRLVLKSLVRDPTDVISSSAFATAWQALLKANEYSQAAYTEFDSLKEYASKCEYPICSMELDSKRLKQCCGCNYVFYCSTACQTSDWCSHRERCGSNRPYRDYLSSPRNKKFLEYLVDREMITHSNLITTRRDELLSDPGVKLPLVFFVDFSQVIPPNIKVYEDVDFIDRWFDSHSNKRIPLIAPFIELRSGFQMRPISISNERSGSMFGWLDEDTDSDSGQYVGSVLDADGDE